MNGIVAMSSVVGRSLVFSAIGLFAPYFGKLVGFNNDISDQPARLVGFVFMVVGIIITSMIWDVRMHPALTFLVWSIAAMYVGYKYHTS